MSTDPERGGSGDPSGDDPEIVEAFDVDADLGEVAAPAADPGAAEMFQAILADDPLDEDAFEALSRIHRDAGDWPSLVALLLERAEHVEDVPARIALLRQIAAVYERDMGDAGEAHEALKLAFDLDYGDDATAAELERLTSQTGRWNDLLAGYNQEIQSISDTAAAVALALRLGRWYAEIVGHAQYALPYLGQVLAVDPQNHAALRMTAAIYRKSSQWPTLAQVLERHAPVAPLAEKKEILAELGDLYAEHLGQPAEAWRVHQELLRVDPAHAGAIAYLERACRLAEEWEALVPILERKAAAEEDPRDAAEIGCQIAEILEERLGQAAKAIEAYRGVLERDARCLPAWRGLERLHAAAGKWAEALDAIETQIGLVETERERVSLFLRRASVLEEEFLRPADAAASLESALEIDPMNETALSGLERLYRSLKRWPDLVGVFERHLRATAVESDALVLWLHLGSVLSEEMGDASRAVEAYEHVLDIDPSQRNALEALTKLYPKVGDHEAALQAMDRLSRQSGDAQKVDLLHRQGVELLDHFKDPAGALDRFRAALEAHPGHLPSIEKMREILVAREDWAAAADALEREQSLTESPRKRARLLVELGRLEAEKLGDAERALGRFEQALALDSENEEAATRVADAYVAAERWTDAAPILEGLVRRSGKRDPEEQRRLHSLLSVVQTNLGDDESAWKALEAAYKLDPTHRPTLRGLADLYFRASDWEGARDFYQAILEHHRRDLDAAEATLVYHRLGVVHSELGDAAQALAFFEKALESDKRHRPTLDAMATVFAGQERWDQVVFVKRKTIEVADPEERHRLLVEIGDLWRRVEQFPKAVQTYLEALAADGGDHLTKHKLLEIYTVTKQWQKVVETVLAIAADESDPAKLAKYYYSIAAICRDELSAPDYAVQYYNEVLDRDPKHAKAFEAIERILTNVGDWKAAERNVRMQLHRIVGQGETHLEIRLWQNLGDIYQHRLGDLEAAAEAFQMAAKLDPDDPSRHEGLAAIYLALPGRHHDAVAEHQLLLAKSPMRTESYKALSRIYFATRQYDPAWCVCAALSFLGRADPEERQFYETYRTTGPVAAQGRLDQARWLEDLFHPTEDPLIGKTLETLTPAVRALKVQPTKAYGLRPKDRRDPATDTLLLSKLFGYVAPVLNLPTPHLYVQPDQPGGLVYAITEPPATVAGSQLLTGKGPQELAFIVARHLAYYRGEHYVRWIMPTAAELGTLLLAGIKIGAPGVKLPVDAGVDQTAIALAQAMQPIAREALLVLCRRLVETGLQLDVKRWLQAIDMTACQAGLLFSNDLETAARAIRDDAWNVGELSAQDKIKELVLFSVSERYFRLRRALGVDIRE